MQQYLKILEKALNGTKKENRTGVPHIGYHGDMMQFDLSEGFPLLTTKAILYEKVFAEMLGFLRGYDNAEDFRALGCNIWDDNANKNPAWLNNENRKGHDDLGSIYGVQARHWIGPKGTPIDQLANVYSKLVMGIDDRRLIVSHWNPGELGKMSLPPCHLLYQFGLEPTFVDRGGKPYFKLNLSMYQRSCDVPLGIPFNIAGYAWLLSVMAHITGHSPGTLTHFMHDIHVYENQLELAEEQLQRTPKELPKLQIDPRITTLGDLESWVTVDCFQIIGYYHDPFIPYPFSV